MARHSVGYRFLPSLAGLVVFSAVSLLYVYFPSAYYAVLRDIGIAPWSYPFMDSEFMYVMKASWLRGIDIYQTVPDYVVPGAKMNYSPLWPRLPLSADKAWTVPVGLATDIALLLSVSLLPPCRTFREAVLLSLAVCSTMVVFALERNNVDVWIFLVVVVSGLFAARSAPLRVVTYALIVLIGLLKYYPVTLLGLASSERPRWALVILALGGCVFGCFLLALWDEIAVQLQTIPSGWAGADMIGIVNLPKSVGNRIATQFALGSGLHKAVELALRTLLTLGVVALGLRLARRRGFSDAMASLDPQSTIWLVAGCLLMSGCLIMGQNIGYRGVFLLFVVPGLLALLRVTADAGLQRRLRFMTKLIVALMWMEGIRFWIAQATEEVGLPGIVRSGVASIVWLTREVLWLDVEGMMLGVIFAFLMQSPTGAWVLQAIWPKRAQSAGQRPAFGNQPTTAA